MIQPLFGFKVQRPFQNGRHRIPNFYLYKMTVGGGGAPCVQNGLLTLAICKPAIRRVAPEGSVIIGFAGNGIRSEGYDNNSIVYAAVVSRRLIRGAYCSKADRGRCRHHFSFSDTVALRGLCRQRPRPQARSRAGSSRLSGGGSEPPVRWSEDRLP